MGMFDGIGDIFTTIVFGGFGIIAKSAGDAGNLFGDFMQMPGAATAPPAPVRPSEDPEVAKQARSLDTRNHGGLRVDAPRTPGLNAQSGAGLKS